MQAWESPAHETRSGRNVGYFPEELRQRTREMTTELSRMLTFKGRLEEEEKQKQPGEGPWKLVPGRPADSPVLRSTICPASY
jgi:hypothetical protein